MTNRARQKGTEAETAVVEFLRANGFPLAERRALQGANDKGDVAGLLDTVIEVKNCKTLDLAGWAAERDVETANAGAKVGAVWAKRRGSTDPGKWYVVLDGHTFVALLKAWQHAQRRWDVA